MTLQGIQKPFLDWFKTPKYLAFFIIGSAFLITVFRPLIPSEVTRFFNGELFSFVPLLLIVLYNKDIVTQDSINVSFALLILYLGLLVNNKIESFCPHYQTDEMAVVAPLPDHSMEEPLQCDFTLHPKMNNHGHDNSMNPEEWLGPESSDIVPDQGDPDKIFAYENDELCGGADFNASFN